MSLEGLQRGLYITTLSQRKRYLRPASKDFSDLAKYETALQQSWDFPDIKDVLSRGRHFLATFEFLARTLAFEDRLRLFRALTSALVELTDPIALYSSAADAFFEPRRWLEVQREGYTITASSTCGSSGSATATTIPSWTPAGWASSGCPISNAISGGSTRTRSRGCCTTPAST